MASSLGPIHVLAYGTLLGTNFFHTFINGPILFKTLERPQFSATQSRIFPIYFGLQTALPLVLALTYPGNATGYSSGLYDFIASSAARSPAIGTLIVMLGAGLANLVAVGPTTTRCMKERQEQEKKDGKKSYEAGPHSDKMNALNKRFRKLHGLSSILNLVSLATTFWYGCQLGKNLL